jgi:hypothetical protein
MYVDHVYQLQSLVYDIRTLCAQVFQLFEFFMPTLSTGQTSLNCDRRSITRSKLQLPIILLEGIYGLARGNPRDAHSCDLIGCILLAHGLAR